jgi:hypothetical protein
MVDLPVSIALRKPLEDRVSLQVLDELKGTK